MNLLDLTQRITSSTNPQIIGLNGRIIDETKSMFTINTKKEQKTLQKTIMIGNLQFKIKK